MAREGKKLELYEILAAKRAKGKMPLGLDPNAARQANSLEPEPPPTQPVVEEVRPAAEIRPPPPQPPPQQQLPPPPPPPPPAIEETHPEESPVPEPDFEIRPGVIVDEAIEEQIIRTYAQPPVRETVVTPAPPPPPARRESPPTRAKERERQSQIREVIPEAPPEPPRPRSPREVVFSLETALILFSAMVVLISSAYFLGYKRGQEEKPAGLVNTGEIGTSEPGRINIRHLGPAPRPTQKPPEEDYTLLLRAEPAGEDLPERLELELAEAVELGKQKAGFDIQGFIFRSEGNSPQHFLTVGLGRTANDTELDKLRQIYNRMDGLTTSRVPTPYLGCGIAPIRELGVSVY